MTKKLALGLAAITVGAYGCSGSSGTEFPERDFVCVAGAAAPCETTEERRTAADRTAVEPEDLDDTTVAFIVSTISLPEAMGGQAAGFNLDGIDSGEGSGAADADCQEFNPDFESVLDPGHVGVDNALQGVLGTIESFLDAADCPGMVTAGCLDALLQEQVNEGSVLLIMEVSGVNSYSYDSDVQLQLVLGALPAGSGTACTTDAECTTGNERCIDMACANAPMLDAGGSIAPGQTFMRMQNLGPAVPGDIFAGRLRAAAETLTLQINAGGFMLPLVISNPEVRFNISADALVDGQIGGYVQNADIIEAAATIAPGNEATVMALVEQIADIEPSADPMICNAISVGITFGATSAVVQ